MCINLFLNLHLTFNFRIFLPDVFEFLSCRLLLQKVYEAVLEFQTLKPAPEGSTGAGSWRPAERQEKKTKCSEEWQEEVNFRHWGCAAHSRWAVQHMLNSEQRPLCNSQEAGAPTGANRRHIRRSHVVSEPKSKRSPLKVITSTC